MTGDTPPQNSQADPGSAETVAELISDRMGELSQSGRRVARTLIADYPSAGLGTVASLAQSAGVSAPSVMRFAVSLGFEGFAAMQTALKNELRLRTEGPLGSVEWEPVPGSQSDLLVQRANTMTASALQTLKSIPPGELDATIALLSDSSRKVYLSGGRYSNILARHLAINLDTIRPKVRFIEDPFGTDISSLIGLGNRDVYVLFDFHRYQRTIIELARHARRRGATIILVTDERLSPAAVDAQIVLPINVSAPSPFYTFSAGIMLMELLVVPVLHALGEKGQERMARWDAFRRRELVIKIDAPSDDLED